MAILNKYKKKWKTSLLLRKDIYYDFVLSHNNAKRVPLNGALTTDCLISYIDMSNAECISSDNTIYSSNEYKYGQAVNEGLTLNNIGFTGIDTSLVPFDKDTITEEEFTDLVQNSKLIIPSGDTRIHLLPVSGNTKLYVYPCEIINEGSGNTYYKLTGGFLQGFYKDCETDYAILPNNIEGAWNLEFVIRPRTDYQTSGNTLNDMYPDNSGIFFYMGTRAENKFVEYYGCKDIDEYPLRFVGNDTEKTTPNDIQTSEGHLAESGTEYEITTDNAYLIYNRTCSGETTDTWKQGDMLVIPMENRNIDGNLYTMMNRTCTGLTTDTLEKYLEEHPEMIINDKCNILQDLLGNAFALKINNDGSIGYKYLIKDCNSESGYKIQEENGFPDTIKYNQWNVINVMFKIINGEVDTCGVPLGERKMKMYIYVNGYLKFVSVELPDFNFKKLNDFCDKQEGVPFNISLGGGTQGLMESVWFNKMTGSKHIFPLEQSFAGTFIGDIRSFKFYNCQMQYNDIKNNYLYEMGQYKPSGSTIKDNIIYYGFAVEYTTIPTTGEQMQANRSIRSRYTAISQEDNSHFFVILSKQYTGTKPVEFTCGGAPMVMNKREEIIDGTPCIVFESGEIYAPGVELSILSDNI